MRQGKKKGYKKRKERQRDDPLQIEKYAASFYNESKKIKRKETETG